MGPVLRGTLRDAKGWASRSLQACVCSGSADDFASLACKPTHHCGVESCHVLPLDGPLEPLNGLL